MNSQATVEISKLTHRYGTRLALDSVDFDVAPSMLFGLLGPNGGGKTTLFKILTTLMRPDSGSVRVYGSDVMSEAPRVRRMLGVVFQDPSLDGKLTVGENLRHHGHLYGLRGRRLRETIKVLLADFGVADRAGELVDRLSGGLRRRAELAKCLLHRPRLLVLDEPTTGLDPGARRDLIDHLLRLRTDDGVTVVLTTHTMEVAEACDLVGILDCGRLAALDSPTALKRSIGGDVVTLACGDPRRMVGQIRERFGLEATAGDHSVRLERARGHEFVPEVIEAFPGEIDSVTVGKPTLEDAFAHVTGHSLQQEGPHAA